MGVQGAAYLVRSGDEGARDAMDYTPEFSRRARGFAVYAAIRSLGRSGIADLIDRCCAHARHFADALAADPRIEVVNDVVLNQVLVRFLDEAGNHDAHTEAVIEAVQNDGTCWLSGTTWQGMRAMRISVSSEATTAEDVEQSIGAILRAAGSSNPPSDR
jgi:glutamate/tyrosine decarboxylase-like PLP-dependent enzyme